MLYGIVDVNFFSFYFFLFSFFFFFPPRFCPGHISGTVTRRDSKLSVLLGPAVEFCTVAYHPIRFVNFFLFFFFFSAKILSGPYLWNHYSQRLQIECAAWFCGLILHCCLPSNSLRYFFFFRHVFYFLPRFFFFTEIFIFLFFFFGRDFFIFFKFFFCFADFFFFFAEIF